MAWLSAEKSALGRFLQALQDLLEPRLYSPCRQSVRIEKSFTMPTMNRKHIIFIVAASLGLSALAQSPSTGSAPAYPGKPIRMIVPFPAGGATDILARALSQKLGEKIGQTVIVDNRPGAGGTIGADAASKSPADGYTLLLATSSTHSIGPRHQPANSI